LYVFKNILKSLVILSSRGAFVLSIPFMASHISFVVNGMLS
jgi:hypothetical protein